MPVVNYIAVLVAAVASYVIGFLWHGPVFGKIWMKLSGITEADAKAAMEKGGMGKTMALAFVQQLVLAYAIAAIVQVFGVTDFMGALTAGFWIWLVVAAMHLNSYLWEKRSMELYLFNIAYQFVAICVMAKVVTMFK